MFTSFDVVIVWERFGENAKVTAELLVYERIVDVAQERAITGNFPALVVEEFLERIWRCGSGGEISIEDAFPYVIWIANLECWRETRHKADHWMINRWMPKGDSVFSREHNLNVSLWKVLTLFSTCDVIDRFITSRGNKYPTSVLINLSNRLSMFELILMLERVKRAEKMECLTGVKREDCKSFEWMKALFEGDWEKKWIYGAFWTNFVQYSDFFFGYFHFTDILA